MLRLSLRLIQREPMKAIALFSIFFSFAAAAALVPFQTGQSECPEGMVKTPMKTCIDKYEWPNIEGIRPITHASGIKEYYTRNPEINAKDMCEKVGKRVCNIDEWIASCSGSENVYYSWPQTANSNITSKNDYPCNVTKIWIKPDEKLVAQRDPTELQRLNQSDPSGDNPECVSNVGAMDMVVNVEEWVLCPGIGDYGWCLMGRYWSELRSCQSYVRTHHPQWHYYETGFRCCKDL